MKKEKRTDARYAADFLAFIVSRPRLSYKVHESQMRHETVTKIAQGLSG